MATVKSDPVLALENLRQALLCYEENHKKTNPAFKLFTYESPIKQDELVDRVDPETDGGYEVDDMGFYAGENPIPDYWDFEAGDWIQ